LKTFPRHWALALLGIALLAAASGCNPAKLVPEGQYLLTENEVLVRGGKVSEGDLAKFIRQQPNRKVFKLFGFSLWLYNRFDPEKTQAKRAVRQTKLDQINIERKLLGKTPREQIFSFREWVLLKASEPVVWDRYQSQKGAQQMEIFLANRGYYDARVADSVVLNDNKRTAKAVYVVRPKRPYRVGTFSYAGVQDPEILRIIDTTASKVRVGELFDIDVLDAERQRITDSLKDNGYFYFSKDYLQYRVDTIGRDHEADVVLLLKKFYHKPNDSTVVTGNHRQYLINNVFIYTDYDPKRALRESEAYYGMLQAEPYVANPDITFFLENDSIVRKSLLINSLQFDKGDLYRASDLNYTYRYLSSLGVYKFSNIRFEDALYDELPGDSVGKIDCFIQLTPNVPQSYSVEVEGTNAAGNFGMALSLNYAHNNFLRGAEIFTTKLKFGRGYIPPLGTVNAQDAQGLNSNELSLETQLLMPKLVFVPFSLEQLRRNAPKTTFALSYRFDDRPDYTGTFLVGKYGYNWRASEFLTHELDPFMLTSTSLPKRTEGFIRFLEETNLAESYNDNLLLGSGYELTFNNQKINKNENFSFFRYKADWGGSVLYLLGQAIDLPRDPELGHQTIFGIPYSQFFRQEAEFHRTRFNPRGASLVGRAFVGVGVPFGNSKLLPFSHRYFSGGANSLRGWNMRNIGPGSYRIPETFEDGFNPDSIFNHTSDIKLEFNIEYRFPLFWVVDGALFLDAGNIWAINEYDLREGAQFRFNSFYRQLAVNTGVGTRFDFSFFVVRLDLGIQLYDPRFGGSPWKQPRSATGNRAQLHFGIGYPF